MIFLPFLFTFATYLSLSLITYNIILQRNNKEKNQISHIIDGVVSKQIFNWKQQGVLEEIKVNLQPIMP